MSKLNIEEFHDMSNLNKVELHDSAERVMRSFTI
jgi:hypothetical protein